MSQCGLDLGRVPVKKVVKKSIKRAEAFKPMPLTEEQLGWAIGHNLQWVLSIVQTPERQSV